ncbi:MAG: MBOAT family protein [Lachnospiraceae bacterium]|nr:MBOAT family protein [Lachnospiraceae bacterium]
MVFSSLLFLILFLPAFLILYGLAAFAGKRTGRLSGDLCNVVLLVFSLFFYAWGEPLCLFLMMLSALVDYVDGRLLARFDERPGLRRLCLVVALLINFSLLGIFKYAGFLTGILNQLPGVKLPLPGIALPIGISFYTFQTTSYSIDVYRREVKAERNYFRYLTYVSMFPQLIAGPIVRYRTVSSELTKRSIPLDDFADGATRFLIGLFRKVLIANELGALWAFLLGQEKLSAAAAWLGLLTFTLQLYFDFSAYSDMAIGLGRMLGFHFNENFNYPLAAVSLTDFWRRWHISLSSWFRDYVYIPLGGNRRGRAVMLRNLFVVWFLTGLWHGASWNYVLWGLYHGTLLVLEKFIWGKALKRLPRILQHVYALVLIVFGFGIFYFEDLSAFGRHLSFAFGLAGTPVIGDDFFWALGNDLPVLVLALVLSFPVFPRVKELAARPGKPVRTALRAVCGVLAVGLFVLCVANLVRDSYNPFLYFRF